MSRLSIETSGILSRKTAVHKTGYSEPGFGYKGVSSGAQHFGMILMS